MAINVAAKLTLNARGFLTGLASSEKAVAKFARFAGKELAGGAISMAGGTAAQSIFSRLGGGAKKVANEVPGVPTISAVANTIQPVIDPMGVKRKMGLALAAAGGAAAFLGTKGVQAIEEVKDLAEQTGLTTSEVQKLTKAAHSSGLEFGNFQTALSAGTATRKEAVESSEKLRKVYEALGITVKDLNNPLKTRGHEQRGVPDGIPPGVRAREREADFAAGEHGKPDGADHFAAERGGGGPAGESVREGAQRHDGDVRGNDGGNDR
jgi:hypothetical protein